MWELDGYVNYITNGFESNKHKLMWVGWSRVKKFWNSGSGDMYWILVPVLNYSSKNQKRYQQNHILLPALYVIWYDLVIEQCWSWFKPMVPQQTFNIDKHHEAIIHPNPQAKTTYSKPTCSTHQHLVFEAKSTEQLPAPSWQKGWDLSPLYIIFHHLRQNVPSYTIQNQNKQKLSGIS